MLSLPLLHYSLPYQWSRVWIQSCLSVYLSDHPSGCSSALSWLNRLPNGLERVITDFNRNVPTYCSKTWISGSKPIEPLFSKVGGLVPTCWQSRVPSESPEAAQVSRIGKIGSSTGLCGSGFPLTYPHKIVREGDYPPLEGKTAPLTREELFLVLPFLGINSPTFECGAKIVPLVELC